MTTSGATPRFNPFPGLRPFQAEEDYLFFGREEQTSELLALLRQHRFLAVVGTSGSGKSSLVRAGLLAALHGGTMAQAGSAWEVIVLRPGGDPIDNLAQALLAAELYDVEDAESLPRLKATLTRSRAGLVEAVRQSELPQATNLLVVVDQFEELFRFRQRGVSGQEDAAAFVRLLLAASQQSDRPIYVAITMRSDYLGDCAQVPGLAEAVNDGEYLIPRLSREQRRAAIEKPVSVGGGTIAARLVHKLLNDVGDDPDQLPVMQHALMRIWDTWAADHAADEAIDLRHYERAGGLQEALSLHADEVYDELPSDRHRLLAEKLFKSLTERGGDNRGTRRPTRLAALCAILNASEGEASEVIEAFRKPGRTFLMPMQEVKLSGQTVIDISHESLMRVWRRLRTWVEEESQSARIYRRLADTAALNQEGKAGLYHDPDLQIALSWQEATRPIAAWAERYHAGFDVATSFLDESRRAARAEEEVREAARRHELEQAQRLAEAERLRAEEQARSAYRLKWLVRGLAGVAAVALVASLLAVNARQLAQHNAEQAQRNAQQARLSQADAELAARKAQEQEIAAEKSKQIAEKATQAAEAARQAERRNLYASQIYLAQQALEGGEQAGRVPEMLAGWLPNADASDETDLRGWEWYHLLSPRDDALKTIDTLAGGFRVAWSPDNRHVAVRHLARGVQVFDTERGNMVATFEVRSYGGDVAFSVDGRRLTASAAIAFDQSPPSISTWDLASGLTTVATSSEASLALALSPDGKQFATGQMNGVICIRDADSGQIARRIHADQDRLWSLDWHPHEPLLAAAGGSGTVTIWDPATGQLVKTLRPGAGSQELFQVAWSPDGRRLAWSGTASLVRIWDYSTGHETESLGSQSQGAMSLAWAPDGGRLAVANGDRVGVWHTPYGGTARLEEINRRHADRVFSVAWSPDGERLASVGADRTLRIWDAQRSTPGGLVEVTGAPVRALAWDRSAAVWRGLRG